MKLGEVGGHKPCPASSGRLRWPVVRTDNTTRVAVIDNGINWAAAAYLIRILLSPQPRRVAKGAILASSSDSVQWSRWNGIWLTNRRDRCQSGSGGDPECNRNVPGDWKEASPWVIELCHGSCVGRTPCAAVSTQSRFKLRCFEVPQETLRQHKSFSWLLSLSSCQCSLSVTFKRYFITET